MILERRLRQLAEAEILPGDSVMKHQRQAVSTTAQKAVLFSLVPFEGYRIRLAQIARLTGLSARMVGHALSLLLDRGLLRRDFAPLHDTRLPHKPRARVSYCYIIDWRRIEALPRVCLDADHNCPSSRRTKPRTHSEAA